MIILLTENPRRAVSLPPRPPGQSSLAVSNMRFELFVNMILTAFIVIYIRCVYRIVEMIGEWRNDIMQNEVEFIASNEMWIFLLFF